MKENQGRPKSVENVLLIPVHHPPSLKLELEAREGEKDKGGLLLQVLGLAYYALAVP
jgi:hypothetical protein